jgi:ubiquinone/menaquinone biosynthesis C-methylase UbiE
MISGLNEFVRRVVPFRFRRYLRSRIGRQQQTANDTEIHSRQLEDAMRHEQGLLPVPPKALQVRVIGLYSPYFIEGGWTTLRVFEETLAKFGRSIDSFRTVLDFGCGCGRVTRALHHRTPGIELYGTDVDSEAIDWLKRNCGKVAHFSANAAMPPLPMADSFFDLIYGISVFTHLPEEMQVAWLAELNRVTKPGGYVLTSIYDQNRYKALNADNRKRFLDLGFFYVRESVSTTEGLPPFYQTSFHSHDYVRRVWSKYFRVVDIQPLAMDGHSDLVILVKDKDASGVPLDQGPETLEAFR